MPTPMTEAEFLSRISREPAEDVLPDFLRSHGFHDAAKEIYGELINREDDLDGFSSERALDRVEELMACLSAVQKSLEQGHVELALKAIKDELS